MESIAIHFSAPTEETFELFHMVYCFLVIITSPSFCNAATGRISRSTFRALGSRLIEVVATGGMVARMGCGLFQNLTGLSIITYYNTVTLISAPLVKVLQLVTRASLFTSRFLLHFIR